MTASRLTEHFPNEALALVDAKGVQLVEKLGMPALREVVTDVLCGVNLRNATETFTRTRVGLLNAALIATYIRARESDPTFPEKLAEQAKRESREKGSKAQKAVLRWMLGLTGKQVQNVLRSDENAWNTYAEMFRDDLARVAEQASGEYGALQGTTQLGDQKAIDTDWLWGLYLGAAIGSQTLGTRGSEKSMNGKFYEKLILGGVLYLMGLKLVAADDTSADFVFWLSSRGRKRESDATALFEKGVGIRFDIGFIGPGNTEISLDKVSRFEREIEIGGESHFMHTFIIVDRIGDRSRIVEMAEEIGGTILQMSASYWPRELGERLEQVVNGFESPFRGLPDSEMREAISAGIESAPFEEILKIEEEDEDEEEASSGE